MARLRPDGGVIDRLQQQITQLILKLIPILALNRIRHFVGFFDGVGRYSAEGLLDVPRAACFRIAEAAHDLEKPLDTRRLIVDQIVTHCSPSRFQVC